MDETTWFMIGLVTGIFKTEILNGLKKAGIWLITPQKKLVVDTK